MKTTSRVFVTAAVVLFTALTSVGCASPELSSAPPTNGITATETRDEMTRLVDGTAELLGQTAEVSWKAAVPCTGDLPDGVQFTYTVSFGSNGDRELEFDRVVEFWESNGIDVSTEDADGRKRASLDNQPWSPIDGAVATIVLDQWDEQDTGDATYQVGAWSTCAEGDPEDFANFRL